MIFKWLAGLFAAKPEPTTLSVNDDENAACDCCGAQDVALRYYEGDHVCRDCLETDEDETDEDDED